MIYKETLLENFTVLDVRCSKTYSTLTILIHLQSDIYEYIDLPVTGDT
jgi:hypothetical protein